jgi:hypothetical protein
MVTPSLIMEEIYKCKNDNMGYTGELFGFRMMKIDLDQIKYIFEEFIANLKFIDIERLNNTKRRDLIQTTLSTSLKANLITLLKYGVPPSMRKGVYSSLLYIDPDGVETKEIGIDDNILLLDYIIYSDTKVIVPLP